MVRMCVVGCSSSLHLHPDNRDVEGLSHDSEYARRECEGIILRRQGAFRASDRVGSETARLRRSRGAGGGLGGTPQEMHDAGAAMVRGQVGIFVWDTALLLVFLRVRKGLCYYH